MSIQHRFSIVKGRLQLEMQNIGRLRDELMARGFLFSPVSIKDQLSDQFTLRAVGSILHDFYTCVENLFRVIARNMDESMPETPEWHNELLQQMSLSIEDLRPYVISPQTLGYLNEFRGFRHIFRNTYGFNLVGERMERLLRILPATIDSLAADIDMFVSEMESALRDSPV